MKRSNLYTFLLTLLVCFAVQLQATAQQAKPFWSEIQAFQKQDSIAMPPRNGIVFVGSSSVRMWKDAEEIFKKYQVINRGFGGSTLADAILYQDELIFRYEPRQVVIYTGENDVASGVSATETFDRFKTLVTNIRTKMPEVPLVFMSMKESPSRVQFRDTLLKANAMIKDYISTMPKAVYLDVNAKMLDKDGNTRPELFREDMLHMKQAGYDIWEKALRPHLLKK
jgi:lysophospholipase L1-like esterase